MNLLETGSNARVAVLVDCDNTTPKILEFALRVVAQLGRVVLRRGYGNHSTLANKWQESLVRLAFTPCLQYQYAEGKNTSDVGLGALGQYLKRTAPGFSPKAYGHAALSDMVRAYPELLLTHEINSGHWVSLKPKAAATASASGTTA